MSIAHTTACRPLYEQPTTSNLVGFFPFVGAATTTTYALVRPDPATRPAPSCPLPEPAVPTAHADMVHRLRLLSGLTWEELGELLAVSRRTLHNWANGAAIKPAHAGVLRAALAAIEALRRPSSLETRLALLAGDAGGQRPLDLLKAKQYPEAIAAVRGMPPIAAPPAPVAGPERPHPVQYLGALNDPVAPSSGAAIRGRLKPMPRPAR